MRNSLTRFAIFILGGTLLLAACNSLEMFQKTDDKVITSDIQAKLFQDPTLKSRDIQVVSQKGVVVLSGTVASELEKTAVERLANQANGVKQVINQLTVSAPAATLYPAPEQAAKATPATPAFARATTPKSRRTAHRSGNVTPPSEPVNAAPAAAPPAASSKPTEAVSAPPPAPPAPPEPEHITIPAGTVITVRMIDGIDSSRNRAGEEFAATVDHPIVVGDRVVIPRDADARVRLVEARSAGHMTGSSELELELVSVAVGGNTYSAVSEVNRQQGASRGKRTAETVGGGSALGALIGAIAGGGKGAAIGAAVGAGAGTAVQASTRGQQVRVPSETKIDFILKAPLTVTL